MVMPDCRYDKRGGEPRHDVANIGLIRPPLVYLSAIGVGFFVHVLWPVQLFPPSLGLPAGVAIVLVAGALLISAVRTFRKAGTPVPGNRPTTTVVCNGPYRFSRNPVYLAFTLFQIGLAALLNSAGLILTLLPALALMVLVVIPREERYLAARFPAEYLPYKRAVRRWF